MNEREEVLRLARQLAESLWKKHWQADSPNWQPLPDLLGLLTQIDNMTVILARAQPQGEPVAPKRYSPYIILGRAEMRLAEDGDWVPFDLARYASPPAQAVPEGYVSVEVAAHVCDMLAELREQGAGLIHGPGSRLRQAARQIRALSAAPKPGGKDV